MTTKHVIICDGCGREVADMYHGFLRITQGIGTLGPTLDFCSADCIVTNLKAKWGVRKEEPQQ